jgi:hypothetical protein
MWRIYSNPDPHGGGIKKKNNKKKIKFPRNKQNQIYPKPFERKVINKKKQKQKERKEENRVTEKKKQGQKQKPYMQEILDFDMSKQG